MVVMTQSQQLLKAAADAEQHGNVDLAKFFLRELQAEFTREEAYEDVERFAHLNELEVH